ncbi:MAG TPA: TIGR00296 family protein [Nitrososphaerales archaeon]|nr:TIGR00296 family protein [Nitrososphaerales archaeon]
MPLSPEEGEAAVTLARETLEAHVSGAVAKPRSLSPGAFSEPRGVFVTLNVPSASMEERLRGCIGFPFPVKKLGEAIREATIAAASADPRFPPVAKSELDSVVIEVSILTIPEVIEVSRPEDLPSRVRIGSDGLIVSRSYLSGLLLPQVATEFDLDQTEFLSQACLKAGLSPDSWLDKETKVQVFQAEIFAESNPRGKVVRVNSES